LKAPHENICTKLQLDKQAEEDEQVRRHIYLQLMRQFIRQMVVEYEYQVSLMQQKRRENNRQGQHR
jgi:hypothetical protein